jgi:hypothetical protein
MNIKTTLILAATAVSLLSTQAFAFRDMGDEGGNSAYAIPPSDRDGGWASYAASPRNVRPHVSVRRQHVPEVR